MHLALQKTSQLVHDAQRMNTNVTSRKQPKAEIHRG
jgi:hypothetical protein